MEEIKSHVFQNGLPALYLYSPSSYAFTAILFVSSGTRFETTETQGLARFYANICLQGSQNFPQKKALWQEIDKLGLSIKPAVYPEYSLYYFSSEKKLFLPSLKLFFDIYFNPSLTEEGIAKEKTLTEAEINFTAKNPQYLGLNSLTSLIFPNSSLGFNSLGQKQTINSINQQTLTDFKNKFYVSQNCLLLIVGPDKNFDLTSLENIVSFIPNGPRQVTPAFDPRQSKIIQEKISQNTPVSYLNFASLCFGRQSEKRTSQNLLLNILIEGRTNKRLKTLQAKKLVNLIRPWIKTFSDCGLFLIQTSCTAAKEQQVLEEVKNQLKQLSSNTITAEELDQAKNYYQNRLLTALSNSLELGLFYGLSIFFNLKEQTPEAIIKKVQHVNTKEINHLAQLIFKPEALSWIIVGSGY